MQRCSNVVDAPIWWLPKVDHCSCSHLPSFSPPSCASYFCIITLICFSCLHCNAHLPIHRSPVVSLALLVNSTPKPKLHHRTQSGSTSPMLLFRGYKCVRVRVAMLTLLCRHQTHESKGTSPPFLTTSTCTTSSDLTCGEVGKNNLMRKG
ncbi:hypothetical protein N658DRAFT_114810 [Parathielavia hyrcaniae]|uniref:Uncharacterized protein n=1 Tax=Parathielavia hyrcaniae TaxID=113614 RepID=A0AAN6Q821_9PEZI|nr:hypothetical protein N658DRAFT_114810 [Parathielavia hyrcaniae]